MTNNNHPAHGPVSLDRLHQIREILSKASAQSDGGNLGYAMADAVKVIDGVIAEFCAEPVAWVTMQKEFCDDERTVITNSIEAEKYSEQCYDLTPLYTALHRSAMLQAGNSPATPDGWQLVPKEPTEAMNKAGLAAMNEHDAINPTYRAMLAAAPQQEDL